jgi:hypothetical protein
MGLFKSLKKVAKTVAPAVIGAIALGPMGAGLMSAAAGGATAGAIAGGLKDGLSGAIKGGIGGYGIGTGVNTVGNLLSGTSAASGSGGLLTQGGTGIGGTAVNATSLPASVAGTATSGSSLLSGLLPTSVTPANLLQGLNVAGNLYSGMAGSSAATDAANIQARYAQQAIDASKTNLAPYTQAGQQTVGNLTSLVNDPNAQASYVMNNPFYRALAKDAEDRLLAKAATSGKLGSGGTAKALQEALLLTGQNLLQGNISNMQNLVNTGYNAAGTSAANTGNLLASQGNVLAAGKVGSQNAINQAITGGLTTAAQLEGLKVG